LSTLTFAMGPVHLGREGGHLRRELGQVLTREVGVEVRVVAERSYADLASTMSRGEAQLGWMSPALFVRAESGARIRLLCAIERSSGEGYRGVLFAPASSPIRDLAGLEGARVAWVDRDSCAGHLFVRHALRERGLEPSELFSEQRFTGSHAAAVRAVIDGEVDCASTHARTAPGTDEVQIAGWHPYAAQRAMRPLLVSAPIPPDVICVSSLLDPDLVGEVREALLGLHAGHAGLLDEVFSGPRLVAASTVDYDPVRIAMQ